MSQKSHPRQKISQRPVAQEMDGVSVSPKSKSSKEKNPKPTRPTGINRSLGKPLDRENVAAVKAAFTPTSLATTPSVERNDPLLDSAILVEGSSTGVPYNRRQTFMLDYSEYVQLIQSSYAILSRSEKNFKNRVARSQYYYYCITLLWKRLLTVISKRGDAAPLDLAEVMERKVGSMAVPKEIGMYLDGIGDVVDYSGVQNTLALQGTLTLDEVNGISGTFGAIDVNTHYVYETLPSPHLALQQVVHDYAYTKCHAPQIWNVPEELRPPGPVLPNRNLLGWDSSTRLTPEQAQFCVSAGIYAERVHVHGEPPGAFAVISNGVQNRYGYPVVFHLLSEISTMLATSKLNPAVHPQSVQLYGSVAQTLHNVRENPGLCAQGIGLDPVYLSYAKPLSSHKVSANIMSAASIFRYRVQRFAGTSDCLCFTGQDGGAPDGWLDTADVIYDSTYQWNVRNFVDSCRHAEVTMNQYCSRVRGVAPHA